MSDNNNKRREERMKWAMNDKDNKTEKITRKVIVER